ncbi:hypothetical protein [Streptomyces pinistramenti]|uniref:hypothetical protein n=1 Tax=Streptomyces pinistramenti TaxID=2884812 RepID=UPI001D076BB0|nr:hypothetical protein [Streptomyces pinistramenti]MCB5908111.1 hypothetical protein [Streptomyces pinistramenti]
MQISTGERSGGGRPSEGRILTSPSGNVHVVLDGVSTLSDDIPRGGWYAQSLGEEFLAQPAREQHLDLRVPLREAITTVALAHGLEPGASPAATVAIVRHRENVHMVDALVLVDTPVIAVHRDGRGAPWRRCVLGRGLVGPVCAGRGFPGILHRCAVPLIGGGGV